MGNRDDHPRNHGLLHDGTGWRLSKAFDITPLPTFTGMLAMAVTADGSADCTPANLLCAAPHFGMCVDDAAAWLGQAARHVAQHWAALLLAQGVPTAATAQFNAAFALSNELAESPEMLEQAVSASESIRRGSKFPR